MIMASARRPSVPSIDLLAWPTVADARAAVEAAEAARDVAFRRWKLAPHGEIESRLKAFREATQEALTAAAALKAVLAESVH